MCAAVYWESDVSVKSVIVSTAAVLLLGVGSASATPIGYDGTLANGVGSFGTISQAAGNPVTPEGAEYWQFFATAGATVDLFGDRLTGSYDMSFVVLNGTFTDTSVFGGNLMGVSNFVAFGDDQDSPNLPGPFGDPHVIFTAPTTGSYTVAVTNFESSAAPPFSYRLQGNGISTVPEPASLVLVGTGFLGLAMRLRSRGQKRG
jgi:hypothetical protein